MALDSMRTAAKACTDAGDSEGVIAIETQIQAQLESMYEALPMAARIAHWEGRCEAQVVLIGKLEELTTLQQAKKLVKTRTALAAAAQELATQERKLTELAAEQSSWGSGFDLAAPVAGDSCDSWDG